jgi:hypothetical protein
VPWAVAGDGGPGHTRDNRNAVNEPAPGVSPSDHPGLLVEVRV